MKKKILLFAILTLFLMAVIPDVSFAAGSGSRVVDSAGLLTESQRNDLSNKLDNISSKYGVDVVIYTDTTEKHPRPARTISMTQAVMLRTVSSSC